MLETEALLELGDLAIQGVGIGRVALEHLDRHWTAIGGTKQAVDDLLFALLAITGVAVLRQLTMPPFNVAGGDVVEHQATAFEMMLGQRPLHGLLTPIEPIQRVIERGFIDRAQAKHLTQAGGGGQRRERPCGGEFRRWCCKSGNDHGNDQVPVAVAARTEHAIQADLPQRAEDGGNMAVRERALDREDRLLGRQDRAALEQRLEALDEFGRPIGEIEDGAFLDLAVIAIRFTQQDGGQRVSIGHGFDVHGLTLPQTTSSSRTIIANYMATNFKLTQDIVSNQ